MKKKIFLFAFAALIAVSSCTSEINEEGFVDKANSISFNAYSNKSRAVTGDVTSKNMKGDNFGVAGYTGSSIYLYKLDNTVNKAVEQTWVPSGEDTGSWEYANMGDLKFWPNQKMDFYAYFPFSDKATFTASNANDASGNSVNVMTIPNVDCTHDVLFAYAGNQSKQTRVPLNFYHAFAKMKKLNISMPAEGTLNQSGCQIEVQKVEFINTSTSGSIKVNNAGVASYDVAASNVTLKEDLLSPTVTVNKTNTSGTLIDNQDDESAGYFFATNTDAVKNVKGTAKTMWDGDQASIAASSVSAPPTLSASQLVCLKLTCKVWNGADDDKYYYVGGDSSFGEIYIPLKGNTDSDPSTSVTTFDAGKRYIYNIVMKDNVGFDDKGDPILTPILFNVSSVVGWEDVTVTITL